MARDVIESAAWPKWWLRNLLTLVVLALVFEGLLRRLAGGGAIGKAIFFLKDLLVFGMVPPLMVLGVPSAGRWISGPYRVLSLAVLPLLALTAIHSPALALFGAKQYLLFPVVGLATVAAFYGSPEDLLSFVRRMAWLILPTGLLAIYQLSLPADHWLNLSPEGLSLESFSAGGRLRVSSTFPFVAQFCMFLNAAIYIAAMALLVPSPVERPFVRYARWSLIPILIIASFATGSRAAIVGGAGIIAVTAGVLFFKGSGRWLLRFAILSVIVMLLVGLLSVKFPQYFEAYSARKEGTQFQSHDAEMADRIGGMLTRWYTESDPIHTLIGYGLGIMSNGSEQLSDYAASVRMTRGWGETEFANVFLEGGLYLVGVWLTFRGIVFWQVGKEYFRSAPPELVLPLAFVLGYSAITGVFGTFATQPAVAIWWWLSMGITIVLCSPNRRGSNGVVEQIAADDNVRAGGVRGRSAYAERLHRSSEPKL